MEVKTPLFKNDSSAVALHFIHGGRHKNRRDAEYGPGDINADAKA
jgi:hypothetical protein